MERSSQSVPSRRNKYKGAEATEGEVHSQNCHFSVFSVKHQASVDAKSKRERRA